jgi:hypothetical protein
MSHGSSRPLKPSGDIDGYITAVFPRWQIAPVIMTFDDAGNPREMAACCSDYPICGPVGLAEIWILTTVRLCDAV